MAFSAAASGPDPRASGALPRDPSPPGTILTGFPGDALEWASVLDGRCPECGFDASQLPRTRLGEWIRANAAAWPARLVHVEFARPEQPGQQQFGSVLEHACHVRDVHRLFAQRVALIRDQDDPALPDWDTAVSGQPDDLTSPTRVAIELLAAAQEVADAYDALAGEAWTRPGRRGDGSRLTIESLGRFHVHDVEHHLRDVTGAVE